MGHLFSLIMEYFVLEYLYKIWSGFQKISIRLGYIRGVENSRTYNTQMDFGGDNKLNEMY